MPAFYRNFVVSFRLDISVSWYTLRLKKSGVDMDDAVVLVVDDEEILRKSLRSFLEDEGFTVETAAGGSEALGIVESAPVAVMLVDMNLPDMNGESVILRALKIRPSLKIIVHTGDSGYSLPEILVAEGVSEEDILFKPVLDMDRIAALVRRVIKA